MQMVKMANFKIFLLGDLGDVCQFVYLFQCILFSGHFFTIVLFKIYLSCSRVTKEYERASRLDLKCHYTY